MARTTATHFTGPLQFPYATAGTDAFKKEDVQTLALAVDGHDHTAGKGLALPASAIPPITSAMIADGTIVGTDLAPASLTPTQMAPNSTSHAVGSYSAAPAWSTTSTAVTPTPVAVTATFVGGGFAVIHLIPLMHHTLANARVYVWIQLDGVNQGIFWVGVLSPIVGIDVPLICTVPLAVNSGSHTFTMAVQMVDAGTLTFGGIGSQMFVVEYMR